MDSSAKITSYIKSFLDEDDWHYEYTPDASSKFKFTLTLDCKLQKVNYRILVRKYDYTVYATCPMSAKDCLPQMAEFLTRANYGTANGNFEMDFRDGEIRYKCFVNCDETVPGTQTIKESIYIPGTMFKRYGDGILAVIFGMKSPEQAVADCEAE